MKKKHLVKLCITPTNYEIYGIISFQYQYFIPIELGKLRGHVIDCYKPSVYNI